MAAAALLIDYVLTAAVGISAGVGALVSAVPSLLPHTLAMCLGILLLITIVNLRGVKEAGGVFMIPTYLFVGTLLITILIGVFKALLADGHPMPVMAPPAIPAASAMVGAWLLLKAFASGCTALTGVEAVSNGVTSFSRADRRKRAQNAHRDHRDADHLAGRHRVAGEGVSHRRHRSRRRPATRACFPC